MSNYSAMTIHPETKVAEMADWLDDYFGKHHYGVRFPSDGKIFPENICNLQKSDIFTRGYDGMRVRGKRIGTLWWNDNHGEGDVTLSVYFQHLGGIERVDALKDVIGLLEREYEFSCKEYFGGLVRASAEKTDD